MKAGVRAIKGHHIDSQFHNSRNSSLDIEQTIHNFTSLVRNRNFTAIPSHQRAFLEEWRTLLINL